MAFEAWPVQIQVHFLLSARTRGHTVQDLEVPKVELPRTEGTSLCYSL